MVDNTKKDAEIIKIDEIINNKNEEIKRKNEN